MWVEIYINWFSHLRTNQSDTQCLCHINEYVNRSQSFKLRWRSYIKFNLSIHLFHRQLECILLHNVNSKENGMTYTLNEKKKLIFLIYDKYMRKDKEKNVEAEVLKKVFIAIQISRRQRLLPAEEIHKCCMARVPELGLRSSVRCL